MRCLMMSALFLAMCGLGVLSGRVEAQISKSDTPTDNLKVQKIEKKEEVVVDYVDREVPGYECRKSGCAGPSNYTIPGPNNTKTIVTCNYQQQGSFKPSFCFESKIKGATCLRVKEGALVNPDNIKQVSGDWVKCLGYYEAIQNNDIVEGLCESYFAICYSTNIPPIEVK